MMKHEHIVKSVEPGSIAEEMGIEAGDKLISINDNTIEDVFDYHYYVNDEEIVLLIEKANGEEWELEIEKDYEEDLGIVFEQCLMDEYRSCRNPHRPAESYRKSPHGSQGYNDNTWPSRRPLHGCAWRGLRPLHRQYRGWQYDSRTWHTDQP